MKSPHKTSLWTRFRAVVPVSLGIKYKAQATTTSTGDSSALFSQLPPELFSKILDLLSSDDIVKLALTSRYLCQIATYAYLRTVGCPDPHQQMIIRVPDDPTCKQYDFMTVLRLGPFIDFRTEELVLHFPKQNRVNGDQVLRQFERVHLAISHMRYIKRAVLTLIVPNAHWTGYTIHGNPMERWIRGLGLLLNTILEKGCESLDLEGLDMQGLQRCYQMARTGVPQGTISRAMSALVEVLKRWGINRESVMSGRDWRFEGRETLVHMRTKRHEILVKLSPKARKATKLRHININSTSLTNPPLLQWIYSTLLASPIDSLKTSVITPWPVIRTLLPKAVPKLKHLEVNIATRYQSPPAKFREWLSQFQELESLQIRQFPARSVSRMRNHCDNLLHRSRPFAAESAPLPHLTELYLAATWFETHFSADYEDRFPALRHLTVAFGPEHNMTRQTGSIRRILTELSSKGTHAGLNALNITFEFLNHKESLMRHYESQTAKTMEEWAGCFTSVVLIFMVFRQVNEGLYCPPLWGLDDWLNGFRNMRSLTIKGISDVDDLKRYSGGDPWKCYSRFSPEDTVQYVGSVAKAIKPATIERLDRFEVDIDSVVRPPC